MEEKASQQWASGALGSLWGMGFLPLLMALRRRRQVWREPTRGGAQWPGGGRVGGEGSPDA